MTVATMRSIDRFVGIPLCLFVGAIRQVTTTRNGSPEGECWDTIVVMKMFGLGSLVLSFPFVSALKQRSPNARIVYVTFSTNTPVLERLPFPVEILSIRTASLGAFLVDSIRTLLRLRRMQPQAVFDLEFFSKYSTLLSALSGAPQRFGYDLNARWRRMNITHRVEYQHGRHVVDIFLHLLPKQNAQSKPISIDVVKPSAGEHSTLRSLLTADGINGRRLVAVNINAGTTSLDRRWSPQRFAEVLSAYLERRPETAVILTGDATERRYVQTMLHAHPTLGGKTFNYAGRLSLGEFLALMERVAWLLTNDTAPMHFAASMGTPVVALFGPESPAMYAPLGRGRTLYAGLPCSPCLSVYRAKQFSCPYDTLCMRSLSTTSVLEAIGQVEQETGERSACA